MSDAESLKAKANACVAKSDFKGAVQHLTEAIGLNPKLKELWTNRAFAWSMLGQHDQALADARHCMVLAPAFSKGYLRAGRALMALGKHNEAVDLLFDASEKMPQDYALTEALEDAVVSAEAAAKGGGVASAPAVATPPSVFSSEAPVSSGGLNSSYYYAAVPASERKLPVAAPQKISEADGSKSITAVNGVANGAIREDIARKGPTAAACLAQHSPTGLDSHACKEHNCIAVWSHALMSINRPRRLRLVLLCPRPQDRLHGADRATAAESGWQHDSVGRTINAINLPGSHVPFSRFDNDIQLSSPLAHIPPSSLANSRLSPSAFRRGASNARGLAPWHNNEHEFKRCNSAGAPARPPPCAGRRRRTGYCVHLHVQ